MWEGRGGSPLQRFPLAEYLNGTPESWSFHEIAALLATVWSSTCLRPSVPSLSEKWLIDKIQRTGKLHRRHPLTARRALQ